MIEIELKREVTGWPDETELRARLERVSTDVFTRLGFQNVLSELSAIFTDDATQRQLNLRWRGVDQPTNVLSFPAFILKAGERPQPLMGDIVFALETIRRECDAQQKTFLDHLTHLMIHGILHLLGFDHQTHEDAERMEGLEREILCLYAIPDPYFEPDT